MTQKRNSARMADTTSFRNNASLQAGYGNRRVLALLTACFMLGAGTSAVVYYVKGKPKPQVPEATGNLSPTTTAVLARLQTPIELRFYALLDPADGASQKFADRVGVLLSLYAEQSGNKVAVTRRTTPSDDSAQAAVNDGLMGFNREKANVEYLGLCVNAGEQRETLPRLLPEWESALEADITRAISQVQSRAAAVARQTIAPAVDPQAQAVVRQVFTNISAVSLEEGALTLKNSALDEFKRTAAEMQVALKAAEQRFAQANSPEEKAAAQKALVQLQTQHSEKLQELAARSKAEMEAFEQLKNETP